MSLFGARMGRWPFLALALAVGVGVGIGVGLAIGVLSRSLVLDLIALWPLPAIALVASFASWGFRHRRPRLLALPGLLLFTWLVIGLALHLSLFEWLPSAAGDVARAMPVSEPQARLALEVEQATITLVGTEEARGYAVRPIRRGGPVGVPEALESGDGTTLSVVLTQRTDSAWFLFEGWDILLDPGPTWELEVLAEDLDLDLTALVLSSGVIGGSGGVVRLGPAAPGGSSLEVAGDLQVTVPEAAAVSVTGSAQVPDGWSETGSGWTSPVTGEGWSIVAADGSAIRVAVD